jgi:hypothetical protein
MLVIGVNTRALVVGAISVVTRYGMNISNSPEEILIMIVAWYSVNMPEVAADTATNAQNNGMSRTMAYMSPIIVMEKDET